jgi:hypothetical protein
MIINHGHVGGRGGGVIFDKNLNNMRLKTMAKAIIYKIKE